MAKHPKHQSPKVLKSVAVGLVICFLSPFTVWKPQKYRALNVVFYGHSPTQYHHSVTKAQDSCPPTIGARHFYHPILSVWMCGTNLSYSNIIRHGVSHGKRPSGRRLLLPSLVPFFTVFDGIEDTGTGKGNQGFDQTDPPRQQWQYPELTHGYKQV
jgi:hypothetical protein